jgi:hypothetical protein
VHFIGDVRVCVFYGSDFNFFTQCVKVLFEILRFANEMDLLFLINPGPIVRGMKGKTRVSFDIVNLALINQSEPLIEIKFALFQQSQIVVELAHDQRLYPIIRKGP